MSKNIKPGSLWKPIGGCYGKVHLVNQSRSVSLCGILAKWFTGWHQNQIPKPNCKKCLAKRKIENKAGAEGGAAVGCSALLGVGDCGLHRRTPYGMTNVSMTQLSIARHYGGCTYQGERYIYLPHTDELIRADVLKWRRKQERKLKAGCSCKRVGGLVVKQCKTCLTTPNDPISATCAERKGGA